VRAGGSGRDGSAPATGIARPGQQAAREGPMETREWAGMVAWPWEVVGAQLSGDGTDGAVDRRCRREWENVRHFYSGASPVTSR
jgi:hypothetical protein